MAKKSSKAAGVAVAVGGVAALGLAAYALSQSKGDRQKETSQLLSSGGYGGGATGGYSDAFTESQPSISATVADVLNKVTQTPQAQPTPIIISPSNDDLLPIIEAVDNPQDERSDVKQGIEWNIAEPTGANSKTGLSYGAQALIAEINKTSSPVEYNPNDAFTFAPTSKQADYSSYNAGKTGGNAANTPKADNSNTGKTSDNRSQSAGAQALTGSLSNGTAKNGKQTMQVTSPVSTALNAAGQAFSAVGSFFGGLFGGK